MHRFWEDKLKAFLHDPPDKALILFHRGHERKRDEILKKFSMKYDRRLDKADHLSSQMQRLNIPPEYRMDNPRNCNLHICFKGRFKPIFKHPISAVKMEFNDIKRFIENFGYERSLEEYGFNPDILKEFSELKDCKKTYFLLWRFLPDKYPLGYFLPADTRIPDHNIWDHLDLTAAMAPCIDDDLALLALKIPSVQEFISHSRKLSDLWASSHILSTLIFEGVKAIVEELGPESIIYPQLRGNPMVDLAEFNGKNENFVLYKEGLELGLIKEKPEIERQLYIANFPNVFISFVPLSRTENIVKKVEDFILKKWKRISEIARKEVEEILNVKIDADLWESQTENAVDITSTWIKNLNIETFKNIESEIPKDLKDKQEKWLDFVENVKRWENRGYFYSLSYELLMAILKQKSRLWKNWENKPLTEKKCLMCGRRDALLEKDSTKYKAWDSTNQTWNEVRSNIKLLKDKERLCAVCLIKRVYKSIFKKLFNTNPPEFESLAEIAGKRFIEAMEKDDKYNRILNKLKKEDIELIYPHEWKTKGKEVKDGEKLQKKLKEFWEKKGEPNKYYAILMMDGDKIGKMLSGENLPETEHFMHDKFKEKIQEWEEGEKLLKMKRILTPSHHIAISRALKDFSLHEVPKIVEEHEGFLIYAGGDDVLALFPTENVLKAADKIQKCFTRDFYEDNEKIWMGLGNKASMSAGIVFAHYKWPLYDAIERCREAERKAKEEYGRNAFYTIFIKHSGTILEAGGKWEFKENMNTINYLLSILDVLAPKDKKKKLSHRFIHDLIDAIDTLSQEENENPKELFNILKSTIKWLLKRRSVDSVPESEIKKIYKQISELIAGYHSEELPMKDVGILLKIFYDAYRGE
ncbi:MAG: type III-B CRISPR-associated protein Cas10/Cmr2 [Methanothermobacter tenebrarum]|nr:type III-B CRISPR-associated protein Cas10/Cmr2 [Methanobacteriaceae archaeon]